MPPRSTATAATPLIAPINTLRRDIGGLAILVVTTWPAFILYKSSNINPAD